MPLDVEIDYTNWRGERRWRRITPVRLWFGQTQWHPHNQWLLRARDEKGHIKDFAFCAIHGVRSLDKARRPLDN